MTFEPSDLALGVIALVTFALSYVGASVGLVLGQFRLPMLVWYLGSPALGAFTSMAISTVGALVGAIRHAQGGRVKLRLLATIGVPSAIAAFLTARHAGRVDPKLLEAAIGAALVVSAGIMAARAGARTERADEGGGRGEEDEADDAERGVTGAAAYAVEGGIGAALGALAGLVGLLLGTLRLPLMMRFVRVSTREAVGSNMAIGAATGLLAGTTTLLEGQVDVRSFLILAPSVLLGAALGARRTGVMRRANLERLIALVLAVVGVVMVVRGLR